MRHAASAVCQYRGWKADCCDARTAIDPGGAGAGSLALSLYRGGHTTLTIAKENERQSYFFLLISSGSKCQAVQIILNMSLLLRLSLDCQESERACAASFLLTGGGGLTTPSRLTPAFLVSCLGRNWVIRPWLPLPAIVRQILL